MNKCPHCGENALSVWQKIKLGPAAEAECRECGSRFSVPYWSAALTLPFLLTVLGGFFFLSFGIYFLAATLMLIFMIAGRWVLVPLIKVEPPDTLGKSRSRKR